MSTFGDQFGKEEILAFQAMTKRGVDAVLAQEERQAESTDGPLDAKFSTKAERKAFALATVNDPVALGAFHDEMAQEAGLTPERPISRKWLRDSLKMEKEARDA